MFKTAHQTLTGLSFICLLAIGCSDGERSRTPTDPGPTGGGTKPSALLGSWERTSANGTLCSGMVVAWDGTTGTVTSLPSGCDYQLGQPKWKNYNMAMGTIEETGCPGCAFQQERIVITDDLYLTIGVNSGVGGIGWRKKR